MKKQGATTLAELITEESGGKWESENGIINKCKAAAEKQRAPCIGCGQASGSVCGRCKCAPVCGEACMRRAWRHHKHNCCSNTGDRRRVKADPTSIDEFVSVGSEVDMRVAKMKDEIAKQELDENAMWGESATGRLIAMLEPGDVQALVQYDTESADIGTLPKGVLPAQIWEDIDVCEKTSNVVLEKFKSDTAAATTATATATTTSTDEGDGNMLWRAVKRWKQIITETLRGLVRAAVAVAKRVVDDMVRRAIELLGGLASTLSMFIGDEESREMALHAIKLPFGATAMVAFMLPGVIVRKDVGSSVSAFGAFTERSGMMADLAKTFDGMLAAVHNCVSAGGSAAEEVVDRSVFGAVQRAMSLPAWVSWIRRLCSSMVSRGQHHALISAACVDVQHTRNDSVDALLTEIASGRSWQQPKMPDARYIDEYLALHVKAHNRIREELATETMHAYVSRAIMTAPMVGVLQDARRDPENNGAFVSETMDGLIRTDDGLRAVLEAFLLRCGAHPGSVAAWCIEPLALLSDDPVTRELGQKMQALSASKYWSTDDGEVAPTGVKYTNEQGYRALIATATFLTIAAEIGVAVYNARQHESGVSTELKKTYETTFYTKMANYLSGVGMASVSYFTQSVGLSSWHVNNFIVHNAVDSAMHVVIPGNMIQASFTLFVSLVMSVWNSLHTTVDDRFCDDDTSVCGAPGTQSTSLGWRLVEYAKRGLFSGIVGAGIARILLMLAYNNISTVIDAVYYPIYGIATVAGTPLLFITKAAISGRSGRRNDQKQNKTADIAIVTDVDISADPSFNDASYGNTLNDEIKTEVDKFYHDSSYSAASLASHVNSFLSLPDGSVPNAKWLDTFAAALCSGTQRARHDTHLHKLHIVRTIAKKLNLADYSDAQLIKAIKWDSREEAYDFRELEDMLSKF